jgi:hypothetical protein
MKLLYCYIMKSSVCYSLKRRSEFPSPPRQWVGQDWQVPWREHLRKDLVQLTPTPRPLKTITMTLTQKMTGTIRELFSRCSCLCSFLELHGANGRGQHSFHCFQSFIS